MYEIKNGDVESEEMQHKELENIVIKPNGYVLKVFETVDLKVKQSLKYTFSYKIKEKDAVSVPTRLDKDFIKTNGKSKNLSESLIMYVYCDFTSDFPKYWYLFELTNSETTTYFKVKVSKMVNLESKEKSEEWNLDLSDKKEIIKSKLIINPAL